MSRVEKLDLQGKSQVLPAAAQLRNRRLQQNEISTRLSRVDPDDRTTLYGECKTLRLAIHIAKPPHIEERSGTAARREII
jgi:hypothetical protein